MQENLKIKDIPLEQRPTERLITYGPSTLSDYELLAIILRNGTRGESIISLSQRLLVKTDGIDGLLTSTLEDIKSIKGFDKVRGAQVLAIVELFRRFNGLSKKDIININSPKDVANKLTPCMAYLNQEVLKLLILNTKNHLIRIRDVFIGSLDTSIVHPREIFNEAIKYSGAKIIICHNHPSGDPSPSKEDINITKRIKECGQILGIDLIDHIIIGKNGYCSLKEKGII